MNFLSSFRKQQSTIKKAKRPRTWKPMLDVLESRRMLSTTRFVDDDFTAGQVDSTHFLTIQSAVTASAAGDTVEVAAGLYAEAVTIDKTLKLLGAQRSNAVTRNTDSAHESIIDPIAGANGSNGISLLADNIEVEGFSLRDQTDDSTATASVGGIFTSPQFSGYEIRDNIFANNTYGLYLNSSGDKPTEVVGNVFRHNTQAGPSSGNAIYSDQGLRNAEISHNRFVDNLQSLTFVGGPGATAQTNLHVTDNTLVNDGAMIFVNTGGSDISGNTITNSNGSGIFFGGNVRNTTVTNNRLVSGAFTGINLRVDTTNYNVTDTQSGAPLVNFGNTISGNVITNFHDDGIRLREGSTDNLVIGNVVRHNGFPANVADPLGNGITLEDVYNNRIRSNLVVNNAQDGITLTNATFNTIGGNTVDRNGRDGIRVSADSTGNLIRYNSAHDNTKLDYRDLSTGKGTGDTGNTYVQNRGGTANRAKLKQPNT